MQRVVLPAADSSEHEPDNDSDSEYEQVQSDSESERSSSSDGEQLGRNVSNTSAAVDNEYWIEHTEILGQWYTIK